MHSKKTSVGIRTPETTGQKAAINAVFYCLSKIINTGLIRIKSFMVGCIGHPSGWPVPVAGSSNPMQSATQRFEPKSGGYIPSTGETAMRNHTQKLTNLASKKSQSRFNVLTQSGRSIARKIPFNEAIRLKSGQPDLTIKFSGMESLS
ncbi:MAG: hypothetical protein GQ532_02145 [Methylomarinum sp.]|nr:hypothetical protein [Methylomarinum sp.]